MKKLLLLPILFIALACSTDEIGKTVDPFIGNWVLSDDSSLILNVQSNGRFTVSGDLLTCDGIESSSYEATWSNASDSPVFTNISQNYNVFYLGDAVDCLNNSPDNLIEVIFSDDFNEMEWLYTDAEFIRQ